MWPFTRSRKSSPPTADASPRRRDFSTDRLLPYQYAAQIEGFLQTVQKSQPAPAETFAMDGNDGVNPLFKRAVNDVPDALLGWYAGQRFIGYQTCAMIAQHWLVDKACSMPARDAIRHGFDILTYGDGAPLTDDQQKDIVEQLTRADRRFKLFRNMLEFVRMGRVFGIRVAFFKVKGAGPEYYANPFNPDGVKPGSYEGIVQVDPYWCVPVLDGNAATDPASLHFYEPEWWIIRGQRFHRSHLVIFRNGEVPDILKPMYMYGGVSVPQRIYERVYAAERTANEAPQLAMTKRLTVQNTDLTTAYSDQDAFLKHMQNFVWYRDNYGVKLIDTDDQMQHFDTSLADLDAVIMTQYQIVAAAAGVPATKLLGTTPKGFNATGEYEAASYHEELETIQAHDLTDLVDRHHLMVMRSEVEPALNLPAGSVRVEIDWAPVDSPTAKEYAEINKLNADTDNVLSALGAIDAMDVRNRLRSDKNSGYADLEDVEMPGEPSEQDILAGVLSGEESPQDPPL